MTPSRADVAQQQKRRRPVIPAFPFVRTTRLFANRVKLFLPDQRLNAPVMRPRLDPDLEPPRQPFSSVHSCLSFPLLSFPTFLIGNPVSLIFGAAPSIRDGTQAVPYGIMGHSGRGRPMCLPFAPPFVIMKDRGHIFKKGDAIDCRMTLR